MSHLLATYQIMEMMSGARAQVLKEFYLEMRRERAQDGGTPITTRQLESLKRLAQARAKLEMRSVFSSSARRFSRLSI